MTHLSVSGIRECYVLELVYFYQRNLTHDRVRGISYVVGYCSQYIWNNSLQQQAEEGTPCIIQLMRSILKMEAHVSSRAFHEGKSQIANQLTAAWQCGRIQGMCWSHVAQAPDLTTPPHPTSSHPQPAQQRSCLKGLFNIQKMRASAFCAHTQSEGQTQPVSIRLMKQKLVKRNYDRDTSGVGIHFHTHSSNNSLSPLYFCNLLHSHSFQVLTENILENPTW